MASNYSGVNRNPLSEGRAYVAYQSLLPEPQFSMDQIFKFVVYAMQREASVVFDFYRLPGGPYGYALPASIIWTLSGDYILGKTIYSGFPQILFHFEKKNAEIMYQTYMKAPYFERVSYTDSTGFKMPIAKQSQIVQSGAPELRSGKIPQNVNCLAKSRTQWTCLPN